MHIHGCFVVALWLPCASLVDELPSGVGLRGGAVHDQGNSRTCTFQALATIIEELLPFKYVDTMIDRGQLIDHMENIAQYDAVKGGRNAGSMYIYGLNVFELLRVLDEQDHWFKTPKSTFEFQLKIRSQRITTFPALFRAVEPTNGVAARAFVAIKTDVDHHDLHAVAAFKCELRMGANGLVANVVARNSWGEKQYLIDINSSNFQYAIVLEPIILHCQQDGKRMPVPQITARYREAMVAPLDEALHKLSEGLDNLMLPLPDEADKNWTMNGKRVSMHHLTRATKAAAEGDVKTIWLLAGLGWNMSMRDRGMSPVDAALIFGHVAALRALRDVGADLEYQTLGNGELPIHRAAIDQKLDFFPILRDSVDVNKAGARGDNALLLAARMGHTAVTQLLKDSGADLKHVDFEGNTALIWAAFAGHTGVVQLLKDFGVDLNQKNAEGNTALFLAMHRGHTGVVELLSRKDFGAESNEAVTDGSAPNGPEL